MLNRATNIVIIMVMLMMIIIISKTMKLIMILIMSFLLRHSHTNKVKTLKRSFITKDLLLTYLFIRPGSPPDDFFCVICYNNKKKVTKDSRH